MICEAKQQATAKEKPGTWATVLHIPAMYMPPRLPILCTAVTWLLCDRYEAPGWLIGVLGTVFAVAWAAAVWAMFSAKYGVPVMREE